MLNRKLYVYHCIRKVIFRRVWDEIECRLSKYISTTCEYLCISHITVQNIWLKLRLVEGFEYLSGLAAHESNQMQSMSLKTALQSICGSLPHLLTQEILACPRRNSRTRGSTPRYLHNLVRISSKYTTLCAVHLCLYV